MLKFVFKKASLDPRVDGKIEISRLIRIIVPLIPNEYPNMFNSEFPNDVDIELVANTAKNIGKVQLNDANPYAMPNRKNA